MAPRRPRATFDAMVLVWGQDYHHLTCSVRRGHVMKLPVAVSRAWRLAVLAGVLAGLTVTPAAADQGQPVLAGQTNTETASTVVWDTTAVTGLNACHGGVDSGLVACGG